MFEDAEEGTELRFQKRMYRVTKGDLEYVDVASDAALVNADASWDADAEHRYPEGSEFVYVLGGPPDGGHKRLRYADDGQRFSFQGRVFEVGSFGARMTLQLTGEVIAEVTDTFRGRAAEVLDLVVTFEDGSEETITGTHEHPFFVPAVGDYVKLGELEAGTTLRTSDGNSAWVVSLTPHERDLEVFNIEVEGPSNYFVSAANSDGPGVLVHNKPIRNPASAAAIAEGSGNLFTSGETAGLKSLFGAGADGAKDLLGRVRRGGVDLPAAVTGDTLRTYRGVAERALEKAAGTKSEAAVRAVQSARIQAIDALLDSM